MESRLTLVFLSTVLVTAVLGKGVYLEFDGKSIPNNSVVNYNNITTTNTTDVGSDLRCVTERMDCCSPSNKTKAEWFTPNENPATTQWNVYRNEAGYNNQKGHVSMSRKESTTLQEGLYYCNIIAVNGDISTFYVGIYAGNNSGKPTVSGIAYHQLNPEMFTLTCTSTGGPATNVTWTLNGSEITYGANHVLTQTVVNTKTAEYNNTLTVTGREPGNYQCIVNNTRGSDVSQLRVVIVTGALAITPSPCLSSTRSSMTAKPITTILSLEIPIPTTINKNPSSSSHPTEIPTSIATTALDDLNPSSSSHPPKIPTSTTASDNQNPSSSPKATATLVIQNSSSSSQLPVTIAVAAVGLILCIILIVVLILALTVCKGTWPWGKKTQGRYGIQQSDDTGYSVNQHQTNPSTGQTLTAQLVNHTTITGNSDPLYSAVTDTTTPNVDPLYSAVTTPNVDPLYSAVMEPPIPMKCIHSPTSILTHDEDDQTVGKEDESSLEGNLSSTKQESKADESKIDSGSGDVYAVVDKPKKVKCSAQSESRADPITMETVGSAGTNAVYAVVQKDKKEDSPPPLPAPYQEELQNT